MLEGRPLTGNKDVAYHNIRHIARAHIILGSQLRSCLKGHYEAYTPYPYCPACGDLLVIGPYPEEVPNKPRPVAPLHRLRPDPRNQ